MSNIITPAEDEFLGKISVGVQSAVLSATQSRRLRCWQKSEGYPLLGHPHGLDSPVVFAVPDSSIDRIPAT
jgi:hypothetical protein